MKKKIIVLCLVSLVILQFSTLMSYAASSQAPYSLHSMTESESSDSMSIQVLCPHDIVTTRYGSAIRHTDWHVGMNEYDMIVICNTYKYEYPYSKFCEICLTTISTGSTFSATTHSSCVLRLY